MTQPHTFREPRQQGPHLQASPPQRVKVVISAPGSCKDLPGRSRAKAVDGAPEGASSWPWQLGASDEPNPLLMPRWQGRWLEALDAVSESTRFFGLFPTKHAWFPVVFNAATKKKTPYTDEILLLFLSNHAILATGANPTRFGISIQPGRPFFRF